MTRLPPPPTTNKTVATTTTSMATVTIMPSVAKKTEKTLAACDAQQHVEDDKGDRRR